MRIVTLLCCSFLLASAALAQTDAKTNFEQKCATCHGNDGKAQTMMAKKMGAPDLTSATIQSQTDQQIRTQITEGKGKMPPYGGILGKAGVDEMVKYVRSLGPQGANKSAK
jgi:mono/diheme cytochrome c family protein